MPFVAKVDNWQGGCRWRCNCCCEACPCDRSHVHRAHRHEKSQTGRGWKVLSQYALTRDLPLFASAAPTYIPSKSASRDPHDPERRLYSMHHDTAPAGLNGSAAQLPPTGPSRAGKTNKRRTYRGRKKGDTVTWTAERLVHHRVGRAHGVRVTHRARIGACSSARAMQSGSTTI